MGQSQQKVTTSKWFCSVAAHDKHAISEQAIAKKDWAIFIWVLFSRNPHLTLTLSPPIRWERRGDSNWTSKRIRKGIGRHRFHGAMRKCLCGTLTVAGMVSRDFLSSSRIGKFLI